MEETTMKVWTVRLPDEMVAWLNARAEELRRSRSDVIRLIIEDAMGDAA
jgi:predicted DNA-binding protein